MSGKKSEGTCPFCLEHVAVHEEDNNILRIECPRCISYRVTDEIWEDIPGYILDERQRANISGWLYENPNHLITTKNIETLSKIKTPSFHEKVDKLLLAIEEITDHAGQCFELFDFKWLRSAAWSVCEDEFKELLDFLVCAERLTKEELTYAYKIAPTGWLHLETLKAVNVDSKQGFVAMWFDPEMQGVFDAAIGPGIVDAGYRPHLVNMREHNEKIDDEIITQIRRSRFVLADFTGHRGGVYFEAGYGRGLGLEVFWTCRKDELEKLHFDIRQYNCIDWEPKKLPEFRKHIADRIEAVLGRGCYR